MERVIVDDVNIGPMKAYVLPKLPNNLDLIIGLDVVLRLGLQIVPNGSEVTVVHIGAVGKVVGDFLDVPHSPEKSGVCHITYLKLLL